MIPIDNESLKERWPIGSVKNKKEPLSDSPRQHQLRRKQW
jgi:hypothetical protein